MEQTRQEPAKTNSQNHESGDFSSSTSEEPVGMHFSPPPFQLTAGTGIPVQMKGEPGVVQRTATPTVSRGGGTHTVVRGDNLWTIARETYGQGRYWTQIKDANPDGVHGRSLIHPDTVLILPTIDVPIMSALDGERDDEEGLRDLAVSIPEENYQAFRSQLSQDEMEAHGEFLQMVDMVRRTGMTIEEMGEAQRIFLEGEAARQGISVGEYIANETAARGYGGGTATWWPSLTPDQQADWRRRFRTMVRSLRSTAPDEVRNVIRTAQGEGGGIRWAPEDCERLGAFGFTRGDWTLYVGQHWLEAAEADQESVYANIVHEMGGHNEYGNELGWDVMSAALESLPESERNTATAGGNSVFSAYGYMETEIWAELREHQFDRDDNPTDHAFDRPGGTTRENDVQRQLQRIHDSFAPAIAEALVRSLYQRASQDSRVSEATLLLFADRINTVFGFTP